MILKSKNENSKTTFDIHSPVKLFNLDLMKL